MNRYERFLDKERRAKVEQELAKELNEFRLTKPVDHTWRMKDGRVIRVALMDNEHLMRAISFCYRTGRSLAKVGILKIEARKRGLI